MEANPRVRFARGAWRGFDGNVEVVTRDRALDECVSFLSLIRLCFQ